MQPGHRFALLLDPHGAWEAVRTDLAEARHHIDIELYMLAEDAVGDAFILELARACARGVQVRLLLDGIGTLGGRPRLLARLRAVGVRVSVYHPLALRGGLQRFVGRNHRKTLIIDGRIAHVMGMNMGCRYYALHPHAPTWADAGVRVEGPLVSRLSEAFGESWTEGTRDSGSHAPVPPAEDSPDLPLAAGEGLATAVFNGGGLDRADVHRRYLHAIRVAAQRVWLAHSYFLPPLRVQRALCQAARRGADVRILVPAIRQSDVPVVSLAVDHALGRLLARGVRVFLMTSRMMHGKFAVVDDEWWTVGSANLDRLSGTCALETNVVGVGSLQARELSTYFESLCAEATELTWNAWKRRPFWRKWLGRVAWRLRSVL